MLSEACGTLRQLIQEDDLEKYLDVYDISNPDLQEASLSYCESEFNDTESLKVLRILQYRSVILRRVLLCSLLALEADGGKPDFVRWRTAVSTMEALAATTGEWSEKINRILSEEERMFPYMRRTYHPLTCHLYRVRCCPNPESPIHTRPRAPQDAYSQAQLPLSGDPRATSEAANPTRRV